MAGYLRGVRRRAIAAGAALVAAGSVVGILALAGVFSAEERKPPPQTSFAFDSRYEDERGEELARSEVMAREEKAREKQEAEETPEQEAHHGLGGNFGIDSEDCTVSPPPPDATRMFCRVSVEIEEIHEHGPTTKEIIVWSAEVLLNSHSGELAAHVSRQTA